MSWICTSCSTANDNELDKCIVCDCDRPDIVLLTLNQKKVAESMFSGDVLIPMDYNIIGEGAFKNRKDITSVIIHENVIKIGKEAFSGCTNLTNIICFCSLETISTRAFYNCTQISEEQRPTAKYVAPDAFSSTLDELSRSAKINFDGHDDYLLKATDENIDIADIPQAVDRASVGNVLEAVDDQKSILADRNNYIPCKKPIANDVSVNCFSEKSSGYVVNLTPSFNQAHDHSKSFFIGFDDYLADKIFIFALILALPFLFFLLDSLFFSLLKYSKIYFGITAGILASVICYLVCYLLGKNSGKKKITDGIFSFLLALLLPILVLFCEYFGWVSSAFVVSLSVGFFVLTTAISAVNSVIGRDELNGGSIITDSYPTAKAKIYLNYNTTKNSYFFRLKWYKLLIGLINVAVAIICLI
ncbi:MAG: leucine-rich repeat protein [Clostridia bacterium]|nr:leucine-rich repeat protein [Clostridia bacterium]